jgi:hypothetical protein
VVDANDDVTASSNFPGSKAHLTSQWVKDNVTHNKTWGPMPFRFVFLDGCNTAVGDWPQAWGVPKQAVNVDWYKNANNNPSGFRPNAFVGWDVTVGGSADWGTIDKFWQFRQFWMGNWSVEVSTGETLKQAFDDAFIGANWVDRAHYNHMKIYGYQDMTFLQYNHAGDWP